MRHILVLCRSSTAVGHVIIYRYSEARQAASPAWWWGQHALLTPWTSWNSVWRALVRYLASVVLRPLGYFWLLYIQAVPCESLVSREFSRIFFQFHFSISISGHCDFTFHSRSRFQGILISLFTLEMSESISNFTLFSREKRVKYAFLVMKNSKFWPYISSWNKSPITMICWLVLAQSL